MKILVIDDQRIFKFPNARHETTSHEGLLALYAEQPWDEVYLDHDLGADSKMSGSDMANHIAKFKPEVGTFIVHSMNPVGREYMFKALYEAGYDVRRIMWTNALMNAYLDNKAMEERGRNPFYQGPTGKEVE